ncbi:MULTISPECIES: glucosamine-6-phosphate deaminase [Thermoactinomyces]|uniref:Glucosamine-6-phosphate deaminase n=1 Tax=Thermoactinomyces daqus TaxID=1329516 RepID=A0A7W2AFY6_9BACL|nr:MULTISPECIES: glucosamine-6-phosphate deaminase [Thermoactinomyces]MBA4541662.1 glucosamine-6-phosphate deaminase [Thermoactinomyces daqus]MBH8597660.1 glucosamine-6-phosphate deaminase [Thermoactinomyces sp. CICC 10523]MBH8604001.1 glucosamine-6-phosphate deaminase [Thermoactinomyces sp. CICC 10522]
MQLIKAKDYHDLCHKAAELILRKVKGQKKLTLGLATGGTPQGVYRILVEEARQNGTTYQHVTTFNLDEYVGLPPDHPQSYHTYMNKKLFDFIDIPPQNVHIPDGMAENLEEECRRYEQMIDQSGGIDLQLLGIGINGHIGFNEPGTSFHSFTHVVKLEESTRIANSRFFSSLEEVPAFAVTMGIASIMKSKEILLLAVGKRKAEVLQRLIYGEVTEELPASVLKMHQHVTIIADEEALSSLSVRC